MLYRVQANSIYGEASAMVSFINSLETYLFRRIAARYMVFLEGELRAQEITSWLCRLGSQRYTGVMYSRDPVPGAITNLVNYNPEAGSTFLYNSQEKSYNGARRL